MTYKKLVSKQISQSQVPISAFEAISETIVSKIYIHNPNNDDIDVKVYFVDKSIANEYDSTQNQINKQNTQAFDIIIPSRDTAIFGNGITFSTNQCIYIESQNDVIIHVFGKIVL